MAEDSGKVAGTSEATEEDEALRAPFRDWLAKRWPDVEDLQVASFRSPKSGFSAKTVFVPVSFRREGEAVEQTVALRLENPEPAIYPQQAPGLDLEIGIQYRAMEGLARAGHVPVAPLLGLETDASVLGTPFFVMGYVPGDVMVEHPPYTQAGFFFEAAPADREATIVAAVESMADFHRTDWREGGFEWLVPEGAQPTLERQIDLWETMARHELRDRVHPDLDRGFRLLRDQLPKDLEPGLSWGDARPGNIIFGENRCLCLTDFENIAVAPIEIDLGYWLMFDRTQHEAIETARLEGEPTREMQRQVYADRSGRPVGETYYYELFGAVRYAAIVVRVMNRLVDRGQMPPDHQIWLHNPAAAALGQILAESAGG